MSNSLHSTWTAPCQAFLSFTISWSLFKFMSIESLMLYNHLILCHFILLLPSVFPSIRVFPNKLVLRIRWPKYWSFSFGINPSNEYTDFRTAVYSGERGERIEREGTFIVLFLFIMVVKLMRSLTLSWEVSKVPELPSANLSLCIPFPSHIWTFPEHIRVDNGLLSHFIMFFFYL